MILRTIPMTDTATKATQFACATPGQNSYALAEAGKPMQIHHDMAINGDTDLSGVVQGKSGARVYGVTLTNSPNPLFTYQVLVDAQGPKGAGSGSLHLVFEDETRDGYRLAITSSTRKRHTVDYKSKKPGLVRFDWSN
jgi:hypothetical protein